MSAPTAVLFDWDNTLVDSWGIIHHAMNETLTAMGHPTWDMAQTKLRVARSMRDAFPAMFGDRWQEARDVFYASFDAVHLDMLKPLPGARDMLQRLIDAGIPLGVVSNKSGKFIRSEADHLGWTPLFKQVLGAGDAEKDKPSPLPVQMLLDSIGVPAGQSVWFIGDSPIDMECAANAGILSILVRHDEWSAEDYTQHPPARIFQSWEAFGRYLDEIPVP